MHFAPGARADHGFNIMAFKPNRELLNVNFEGYKLSEALLAHVSKDLPEAVQVAKLKDEDYSYQHMRAYSLHNHMAVDPYDDSSVYWYTSDGKIQQGSYNVSTIVIYKHIWYGKGRQL